ncbi:hypothetical protein GF396_04450 [Candidatus Pacearchaeota archaeon]|nr:hypothetical protein [Candidatus Pacearchaeota archaeon]
MLTNVRYEPNEDSLGDLDFGVYKAIYTSFSLHGFPFTSPLLSFRVGLIPCKIHAGFIIRMN